MDSVTFNSVTFTCEAITPMFISGADGRTAELRAPSIKGALRFWWRAINVGKYENINEMREKENLIFGGSDEKSGKSNIIIHLHNVLDEKKEYISLTPHHYIDKKNRICLSCGKADCKKYKEREGIYYKFDLELKIRNNTIFLSNQELINFFILFTMLCGIGKRSRRGFGSFKINDIKEKEIVKNNILKINENNDVLDLLNSINDKYQEQDNEIILRSRIDKEKFNYPYIEKIAIGDDYNDMVTLLRRIGESAHKYNMDKIDLLGYAKGNSRLSSPIYVSVIRTIEGHYRPIITTLNTALGYRMNLVFKKQEDFSKYILENKSK